MSRYDRYDSTAQEILAAAGDQARNEGKGECRPRHLLAGLVGIPSNSGPAPGAGTPIRLSADLRAVLDEAERNCSANVSGIDLFRAAVRLCGNEIASSLMSGNSLASGKGEIAASSADLESRLQAAIIGQDHAARLVSDSIRVRTAGFELRPGRPVGVFLFCGPTGVGKTEFARVLADLISGRPDRLLRIDCSEYSEPHQVARLMGAPPSYIGFDSTSALEAFLNQGRNGVLLLDEFEKANPALHRLFLQAFDAGRLTTSAGKTLDLSGLVIVATTNIWAKRRAEIGFAESALSDRPAHRTSVPLDLLRQTFPIELVNRFDEIIAFSPLDRICARRILREQIVPRLTQQLVETRGLAMEITPEVEECVLQRGFSEELGVRNLQRAFLSLVANPLARYLHQGGSRALNLMVTVKQEQIQICEYRNQLSAASLR